VLLNAVVETSRTVAATRSRKTKIEALAATLRACEPDEIATVVSLLTGEPCQGRIGVGWATLSAARKAAVPAAHATVAVAELDGVLDRIQATTGPGSATLAEQYSAAVPRDI
jgi:DNA ligase-1